MSRITRISRAERGSSLMVALRLRDKHVLVVGGGAVAADRCRQALEAGAQVHVVSPRLVKALSLRVDRGEITWREGCWQVADLDGVDLILAAVDDRTVSTDIANTARTRRIPINCADQPPLCDFFFPAVHREGHLQIAVSTGGQAPALASAIRDTIAAVLPRAAPSAVARFGRLRQRVRMVDAPNPPARRMQWLSRLGKSWSLEALAALDDTGIELLTERFLAGDAAPRDERPSENGRLRRGRLRRGRLRRGRLRLVGAGPGDPGLLTVTAAKALAEADLVLADRLVPPAILSLVKGELRIARKHPGRAAEAQQELESWMREGVRAGRDVVRLKCGDPFVFGRGFEEVRRAAEAGIAAEVIPGISSAMAGPLAAGIPVTLRGTADKMVIWTGVGANGRVPEVPHYQPGQTLVLLMGMGRLEALVQALLDAGHPPNVEAAIVHKATHPDQRILWGTLADLPAQAKQAGIAAPATVIIGDVVQCARQLAQGQTEHAAANPAVRPASSGAR